MDVSVLWYGLHGGNNYCSTFGQDVSILLLHGYMVIRDIVQALPLVTVILPDISAPD